jgi:BlaI family transcriptional regulator, penicillinase repressor
MLFLKHTAAFAASNMPKTLSRRERQMMDILYRRGRATASEIRSALPDPPSYSAVRAKLRVLEEKGHVRHQEQSLRYVYLPIVPRDKARQSALRHMLATFFDNSTEQAITALLSLKGGGLAREKLDRLSELIEKAKQESSVRKGRLGS